jgi:hypothetical protein
MTLTDERVRALFFACLHATGDPVRVEGVVTRTELDRQQLEAHRAEIEALLDELPDQFKQSPGGGGWSFLNACMDKHDNQWTGFHRTMEFLFLLGLGLGVVECSLPRTLWHRLPGSMPYYLIKFPPGARARA